MLPFSLSENSRFAGEIVGLMICGFMTAAMIARVEHASAIFRLDDLEHVAAPFLDVHRVDPVVANLLELEHLPHL